MTHQEELACDLLRLMKRIIGESSEIDEACKALGEAHGGNVQVKIDIELEVVRVEEGDDPDDDTEVPERIPYAGNLPITERDKNFLKAMRIEI